ncbi:MAG: hydrogenase expression/formation protein [Calditrichaeota bacterium]|nr:MAG: hydrogenase expression/formation protein [Calditrichota bacterium]
MPIRLEKLYPGKLDHSFLQELLNRYTCRDDRVVQGAQVGEDATVIDMGDSYLVAKSDPITFAAENIGKYAVYVNANDIACMGATPKWFLATILLPEHSTRSLAEKIFEEIAAVCGQEDICYCGGHTEVTVSLDRPIVIGHMLGVVKKEKLLLKRNACCGDHLILANGIPIEATAIIAAHKQKELETSFSGDFVVKCKSLLDDPGISVLPSVRIAMSSCKIRAFHDPTEGGLATAVHEITMATGLGAIIHYEKIPILTEAKLICDLLDLEPIGCISSGALICIVPPKSVQSLLRAFSQHHIIAEEIGKLLAVEEGVTLMRGGIRQRLPIYPMDEVLKIFSSKKPAR